VTTPSNGHVSTVSDAAKRIEAARQERMAASRKFVLGGEEFTYRPSVTMEVMADYYDMASLQTSLNNREAISVIDNTVLSFLEPGQDEKWAKIRSDPDHPLTVADAHAIIEALLEAVTVRPTLSPSASTDGREANGTTSTDGSPSKAATSAA
jgi:hypothetical protein